MEIATKTCEYCGKVIEGNSESHVAYLLFQHKLARHKDKIKIVEKE